MTCYTTENFSTTFSVPQHTATTAVETLRDKFEETLTLYYSGADDWEDLLGDELEVALFELTADYYEEAGVESALEALDCSFKVAPNETTLGYNSEGADFDNCENLFDLLEKQFARVTKVPGLRVEEVAFVGADGKVTGTACYTDEVAPDGEHRCLSKVEQGACLVTA